MSVLPLSTGRIWTQGHALSRDSGVTVQKIQLLSLTYSVMQRAFKLPLLADDIRYWPAFSLATRIETSLELETVRGSGNQKTFRVSRALSGEERRAWARRRLRERVDEAAGFAQVIKAVSESVSGGGVGWGVRTLSSGGGVLFKTCEWWRNL